MATINKRTGRPEAMVINGIDAGGAMTAKIQCGNDTITRSASDGLQAPISDRETQFVRGTITSQDWTHAITLLTGTLGTLVFYERKRGVEEATGYIKHTLINPIIHRFRLRVTKENYAEVDVEFECKAADPTKTISDMWAITDSQAAPTYVSAARGGVRIESCLHGALNVYHLTAFEFSIALPLVKACNDADVAYTCVDALLSGLTADGSITFQDSTVTSSALLCQQLIAAARASLVLAVRQSANGADKTVTITGVVFNGVSSDSGAKKDFTDYTATFEVVNDTTTQLTLAGTNKILTIV